MFPKNNPFASARAERVGEAASSPLKLPCVERPSVVLQFILIILGMINLGAALIIPVGGVSRLYWPDGFWVYIGAGLACFVAASTLGLLREIVYELRLSRAAAASIQAAQPSD